MQSLSVVLDRGLEPKLAALGTAGQDVSGLLIGHRTSSTIYVVHVARTLLSDVENGGEAPKPESEDATKSPPKRSAKKAPPSTPQSESTFDEQSTLQHVRQTIRMLPGGLEIVGFFVIFSPTNKKQAETTIAVNKALRSAFKLGNKISNVAGANQDQSAASDGRMVLLNVDSTLGSKKPISTTIVDCRPDAQASAPSTNVPFSYQNLRWRSLTTRLIFDVPLFVSVNHSQDNFFKQFADAVRPWAKQLWAAQAVVNGSLKDGDEPLAVATGKTAKGKKATEENETDVVDFFFLNEPKMDGQAEAKSESGAVSMRIRGTMFCVAFVHQKATVAEGVQALKTDAIRSLYGRCELHYDGMTVLEGEELDPVAVHQFPRRVFAPLADHSTLLVTDYLFEGDVKGDAVASFKDLLDIDVPADVVEDNVERAPCERTLEKLLKSSSLSSTPEGSIDDLDRVNVQELEVKSRNQMNKNTMVYLILAIIVALLAYVCFMLWG